jgi:hypothetical protein
MRVDEIIASTTAILNANLAGGKIWEKSTRPRKLVKVALLGSTAVGDAAVDISFGTMKVAHIVNTSVTIGVLKTNSYWNSSRLVCPAGTPISVVVTDAFEATAQLYMELAEL